MKKKLIIVLIILHILTIGCGQKTDSLYNIIGLNEIGSEYGIKLFNGLDGKKIELNERFMIEFEGLLKQTKYIDKKRLSRFPLEPGGYIAILV